MAGSVLSGWRADIKNVDLGNAYTNEYADKLRAMGFLKAMGIPNS